MYQLKRSIQSTPLTVHFITSPSTLTRIPLRVGGANHSLHTSRSSPTDPTVRDETSDNTVTYTLKELIMEIRNEVREIRNDTDRKVEEMRADTDRKVEEMRADTDRKVGEMRAEFREMRADTDSKWREIRADTDSKWREIRAEFRELRHWQIGVIGVVLTAVAAFSDVGRAVAAWIHPEKK